MPQPRNVVTPEQAVGFLKNAGATQGEAAQLLSVIPGESGWNAAAVNASSGACGLWQIFPPEPGCDNPAQAAVIALRKLRTQGLGAWAAGPSPGDWAGVVARAWGNVTGGVGSAGSAVGSAVGSATGLGNVNAFFGTLSGLTQPGNLWKAGLYALGGVLIAVGLFGYFFRAPTAQEVKDVAVLAK